MIALARKYRPKKFADLIVQEHIAAALRGAVAGGRVAHGYLFAGPRGVGKTTAARILAMALNCERRGSGTAGEPCGECDSCTRVWTGAVNLDVVELDAASNRGVDDARDLRERAMYAASGEGRHKVYIVDEAHMLTREAWNALLKILEEPPPRVVFVFATTEPQKIAQTAAPILSRLQRFDFRRIGPHAIVDRLRHVVGAEGLSADDEALHLIAKSADGGMRDGLSILDQVVSFGEGPVTAARMRERLGTSRSRLPAPDLVRLLAVLTELEPQLRSSGNARLAVELLLLRWAMMSRTVELEAVIRALGKEPVEKPVERPGKGGDPGKSNPASVLRDAAPVPPSPAVPRAVSPAVPPEKGPLTLDRLRALWPRIVDDARTKTPILGALLQVTEVAAVDAGAVTIRLLDTNAVHAEGLERQREALSQLVTRYLTGPVRIKLEGAEGGGSRERSAPRPTRLTEEGARAERLKTLRAQDPSLNAAVDALDLELLE